MSFFVPEDFKHSGGGNSSEPSKITCEEAAAQSNEKLQREGKVVYFLDEPDMEWMTYSAYKKFVPNAKYKAIFIKIEPIEKCKHEAGKIKSCLYKCGDFVTYQCECGARVVPCEFKEV